MALLPWLRQLSRKIPVTRSPQWDEAGFLVFPEGVEVRLPWNDVVKIFAYKKDCYTVDQIRVLIETKLWILEFSEEHADFDRLRVTLSAHFDLLPDWHETLVAGPAFAPQWTQIYPAQS